MSATRMHLVAVEDHDPDQCSSCRFVESVLRDAAAPETKAEERGRALAGMDAAVAAIEAARDEWLAKPRDPVREGVDIGIKLALALLLIERDREATR